MKCEFCGSENTVKNGFVRGKQRYLCKDCGKNFTLEDGRRRNVVSERIFDLMCCSENLTIKNIDTRNDFIGRFSWYFGVSRRTVIRWIKCRAYHTQLSGIIQALRSVDEVKEEYLDRKKSFLCACINLDDNANAIIIVQRKN